MTTKFRSKEETLKMGIYYAGSKQTVSDLTNLGVEVMNQWGTAFTVETFGIKGEKGDCRIGIENFRDGYALWLITDVISKRV